jgi:hypothetical protein
MSPGESLRREILDAIADPLTRRRVARVLDRYAGRVLYLPTSRRAERERVALVLSTSGLSHAEAVKAYAHRCGVDLSTARRALRKTPVSSATVAADEPT